MQSHYHRLFSLPQDLLQTLSLRELIGQPEPEQTITETQIEHQSTPSAGHTCTICQAASFQNVDEQRAHFRSDWHRYNVKLRLSGGSAVSEPDFAQLVDGLQESISGSESSLSEEGSPSEADAVATLLSRAKISSKPRSRSPSPSSSTALPHTALIWFHSPPSTQLGIYRAIFPIDTPRSEYVSKLQEMQGKHPEDGRKWALFMTAGGHFAGAIVRVTRAEEDEDASSNKRKPPKPKPEIEVIKHKTFHRYTTRRKQGGSQSVNDNAKGNAKSAGAQLRRYGEQALRDDIHELLHDWADEIHLCERIWIRASTSNRRIFLDFDDSILSRGDARLRTFPFPTRRPTQAELTRCLFELLQPKISHLTEDALHEQDLAYLASIKPKPQPARTAAQPTTPKPAPKQKLTKEEEALREKWGRIIEMTTKNRQEALKSFWEREHAIFGSIDAQIPEWAPATERKHTLLHLASRAASEDVVRWLLEDMNADPTIQVPQLQEENESSAPPTETETPTHGRTAYDLAPTREIRNIFRRCAASQPDAWDWLGAGRVPSILTKDMEEEQEEKKKVKRKGLKDKLKEREAKEREREAKSPKEETPPSPPAQAPKTSTGPQKLGGSSGGAGGVSGLTPEMRAKIERERRVRAAEARLKNLGGT